MNRGDAPRKTLTPAHIAGIAAFALSGGLLFFRPDAAAVPLGLFVLLCLAAPFFPRAGFFLPVISRGGGDGKTVALTFDDGPDPAVTPLLLDLLARYRLTAAFFVTGRNTERHPGLVREILKGGHDVGNHSYHHDPLLMLRSPAELAGEIARTQDLLASFGIRPLAFRPPVGVTNPRLPAVLRVLGMECVTFSCRACDFGNRRIGGLAEKILRKVHPGAIILLHDVSPPGGGIAEWLAGVEKIVRGLRAGGYEIVPLSELIGRTVMERLTAPSSRDFS
ncbi:MAG: polysaccharide deacetylase family protein [Syntrophales bacterium]